MKKSLLSLILIITLISNFTLNIEKGSAVSSGSAVFSTTVADFSLPALVNQAQVVVNTGANIAQKYTSFIAANKETFLDGIAYQLSRMMIRQMRDGMVRWIQSGYNGKPSFLVNPEQMLRNMAADQAKLVLNDVAKFASDSTRGMSGAIIKDIRNNQINSQAAFQKAIAPTLGITIKNNVCSAEGFGLLARSKKWTDAEARRARDILCANGVTPDQQAKLLDTCFRQSFTCGGWGSWLDITQNPERNTATGRLAQALNRANKQTTEKQAQATSELNRGNGFFNIKECIRQKNVTVNGNTEQICDEYQSTSPGQKAVTLMNEVVTDPVKQAQLSNEINESINSVASAFLGDLVGRGFKVVNEAASKLELEVTKGTDSLNKSIAGEYKSIDDAINGFTKPNASTPAPAYNKTNLTIVNVSPTAILSLSSNMIKDMKSTANSNDIYLINVQKSIRLLSPYNDQLNVLSSCVDSISNDASRSGFVQSSKDYLADRRAKMSSVLTDYLSDAKNIPSKIDQTRRGVDFISKSSDVNAIQAVYQSFNLELENGNLKRSEAVDMADSKYEQYDRQINGPKDEAGVPIAKGDKVANLQPKISECQCYSTGSGVWSGGRCVDNSSGGGYYDPENHG